MEPMVRLDGNQLRLQVPQREAPASQRYVVTWTAAPGGDVAAHEAQDRAWQLAQYLDKTVRLHEPLRVHLSVYQDTPMEHFAGDIGLVLSIPGEAAMIDGDPAETADVLIGDGAALRRRIAAAVPWSELAGRLARLIKTYQVERCGRDTFTTWARGLSDGELRKRLGLTELVPGQPPNGRGASKEESGPNEQRADDGSAPASGV